MRLKLITVVTDNPYFEKLPGCQNIPMKGRHPGGFVNRLPKRSVPAETLEGALMGSALEAGTSCRRDLPVDTARAD